MEGQTRTRRRAGPGVPLSFSARGLVVERFGLVWLDREQEVGLRQYASIDQVRAAIIRGQHRPPEIAAQKLAGGGTARSIPRGRGIRLAVAWQRPCSARRSRRSRATFAERVLGESDTVRSLLELVGPTMPPRRTCAAIPAVWIRRAV